MSNSSIECESTDDSRAAGSFRSSDHELIGALIEMSMRLRFILGTGVAVELALRQQNADQDGDLADCLRHGICDSAHELTRRNSCRTDGANVVANGVERTVSSPEEIEIARCAIGLFRPDSQ